MLPPAVYNVLKDISSVSNTLKEVELHDYHAKVCQVFSWALTHSIAGFVNKWPVYKVNLNKLATQIVKKQYKVDYFNEACHLVVQHTLPSSIAFSALSPEAVEEFKTQNIDTPAKLFKHTIDVLNKDVKKKLVTVIVDGNDIYFIPMPVFFKKPEQYKRISLQIFVNFILDSIEYDKTVVNVDEAEKLFVEYIFSYKGILDPAAPDKIADCLYSNIHYHPCLPKDDQLIYADLRTSKLKSFILIENNLYVDLVSKYSAQVKGLVKNTIRTKDLSSAEHLSALNNELDCKEQNLIKELNNVGLCSSNLDDLESKINNLIKVCNQYIENTKNSIGRVQLVLIEAIKLFKKVKLMQETLLFMDVKSLSVDNAMIVCDPKLSTDFIKEADNIRCALSKLAESLKPFDTMLRAWELVQKNMMINIIEYEQTACAKMFKF